MLGIAATLEGTSRVIVISAMQELLRIAINKATARLAVYKSSR